jgi:hypothetical protein
MEPRWTIEGKMNKRLAALTLVAIVTLSACDRVPDGVGGMSSPVRPGESMAKLCEAAHALADATGLSEAAIASIEAGDGMAAAELAKRADTRRQDGMALATWSGQLEDHLDPPGSPGYPARMTEVRAAQQAVDLLVGVLGQPAASVTVEARPRLLAAARDAVGGIMLPEDCVAISVPTPAP